jgi:hypothetical protein
LNPRGILLALAVLFARPLAAQETLPFGPGERIGMKVTYAKLTAGRAVMSVTSEQDNGRDVLHILQEVKSEGFFAWLFRYRVDNRLVARWDPATGCSYGLDKRLRQGKFVRDQKVTIDPAAGTAVIVTAPHPPVTFDVGPCVLDILSAFYVARTRPIPPSGLLAIPVYDNGKVFSLQFQVVGRETLDLPPPLGRNTPTLVVEPKVPKGSGLFAQEGDLKVWVTDDARKIPVRARTKVAVGSVSADLESYRAGTEVAAPVTASPSDAASPRPRSTYGKEPPTRPSPR